MKIDTDQYLSVEDAAAAIGASRRAVYRAMDRAEAEGEVVSVSVFSRRLIIREKLDALKARYFPFGSGRRHELAVACGRAGATQKAANAKSRAAAGRGRRKTSGVAQ